MTLGVEAGATYAIEAPYAVTAGKIAEFAAALGEKNPAFTDRDFARSLGLADVMAPPTFGIVVTMPALERMLAGVGVPLHRVVHGAQSFVYHQPICAGQELDAKLTITSVRSFKASTILMARAELSVAGGSAVTCDSTLVVAPDEEPEPAPMVDEGESADDAPVFEPVITESIPLSVGAELPNRVVRVRRTDLVRYAGASGDFNPIHYSDHVARSVGLSGVIAHGMLTMGIAARTVTDVLASPADLKEYSTKFVKPVRVPDDMVGAGLSLGAIVRKELDDAVQIDVAAQARGEKVLGMAKAIVRLPTETRNAK
ncbi:MAG: hypothetical protein HOQ05_01265 [Corynebacteriales bacterium]|nr:hypothetical protein [Mycobacteriales bacterium]